MKTILSLLAVFLLCSCASDSNAQPATGENTYSFQKEFLPLWDLTGTYHSLEGGIVSQFTLSHAANGGLVEAGSSRYDDDAANTHITATASGSGRVRGTLRGGTKGTLRAVGYVSGLIEGSYRTATGRGTESYTVDPVGEQLIGFATVRTCVTGGSCSTSQSGQSFAFGTNGAWNLTVALALNGTALSGTGTIVHTNGRRIDFVATGKYSAHSDLSTIKLVGTGQSTGAILTIKIHGSDKALVSLKGRVLGQQLKYPN